jgi:hypothetical protein
MVPALEIDLARVRDFAAVDIGQAYRPRDEAGTARVLLAPGD